MEQTNFLEIESVDKANQVDLQIYTFVKYSDTRSRYIFKRRVGK
jgi:hypothetical protein